MKPVTFVTKLGASKGTPRSRIWIEGKRLIDHDFLVGDEFLKTWGEGTLELKRIAPSAMPASRTNLGTVSGKGEKPIIDIVGAKVSSTFTGSHVLVEFRFHKISIRNTNQ